jgi:beta-fructofuranosidase
VSQPDAGFGQLEVLQIAEIDGRRVLLFSCLHTELSDERRVGGRLGGIWSVPIDGDPPPSTSDGRAA